MRDGGGACSGGGVCGLYVYGHGLSSERRCVRIHVCVCMCMEACVWKHVCTCMGVRSVCAAGRWERRPHTTGVKSRPKQRLVTPFENSYTPATASNHRLKSHCKSHCDLLTRTTREGTATEGAQVAGPRFELWGFELRGGSRPLVRHGHGNRRACWR